MSATNNWVSGDFSGITEDQYNLLKGMDWFTSSGWSDNFTAVQAGNGTFYEFHMDETGDEGDFQIEADMENSGIGLTYFVYIKSTQSVGGF